ncbi:MAG: PilZ domain-containing protein [Pirellulaceae bacterium]
MAEPSTTRIGDFEVSFDGMTMQLKPAESDDAIVEMDRNQILELFDFISSFTHSELNRRTSFRVPVVEQDDLTVRLGINMKLIDAAPIDLSVNGMLVRLGDGEEIDVEEGESIVLQLGMGFKQLKLEATLRRQSGNELSFQFDPSNYSPEGEPPELLLEMFMELQRVWLTSRFRSRPI